MLLVFSKMVLAIWRQTTCMFANVSTGVPVNAQSAYVYCDPRDAVVMHF